MQKTLKNQARKREPLELVNEFSNIVGYKINPQKSVAFLYTNNEKPEKEIKKIPLHQNQKNKYLETNLTIKAKDLYTENYKMLLKEIKDSN